MGRVRRGLLFSLLLVIVLVIPGCYHNSQVDSNQVGVQTKKGKIVRIVGPGVYSDMSRFTNLSTVDISAKQVDWNDPDLVTRDLQPIGLALRVTYGRKSDQDTVRMMWQTYRAQATSDEALMNTVLGRIPGVAKEITARYTLTDMLGTSGNDQAGRSFLAKQLADLLSPQLGEVGVQVYDVSVTNIDPGSAYVNLLRDKTASALQADIQKQKQQQLDAQLQTEKAQTEIDKEIANRQKQVDQIKNSAFTDNPNALDLEKARVIAEALKNCTSFCNWPTQPQPVVQATPTH